MADSPRYDFDEIDLESGNVHADVVNFVEPGSRVLELGPATGYMSHAFVGRGCAVVGIEYDAGMAARAAAFCERMIVGDLDRLDLEAELGEDRFDAIVSADVIEHLKDPLGALRRLRPFLKESGRFVISIPNIAHASVRLALLSGRFEYGDWGLLDSTHLTFFTRASFERTLDDAGLELIELRPHELPAPAAEVKFDEAVLPQGIVEALEAEPEARAYQYVALAIPKAQAGTASPDQPPAAAGAGGAPTLREALDRRAAERLRVETESLCGEVEALRAENLQLGVRLERILASPPARAYAALRKVPGMDAVRRRRQAGFEAELERRRGGDEQTEKPLVSIVIVTYGAWDWAERAIAAVETNTNVAHEIIVVDNASPDGTADRVRERFPGVRLIANDHNAGFGAANNQAAEVAQGEYLGLVNSDAIVPPEWIEPTIVALGRPGVGAVAPALINKDGTMQFAGAVAAADGSVLALGNGDAVDDPAWRFPRATDFGAAACMLLRRDDFLAAGGFLDAYNPAYFEDVDLCLTLFERGLRTLYLPDVRVLHAGFSSGGEEAAAKMFERNRPTFLARWGAKLAATHPPTLWPPDPAATLAARDALATGRALVVCDVLPVPTDSELGNAVGKVLADLPWARITLAAREGDPEPWYGLGVEVILREDPASVATERHGHYDVVATAEEFATRTPLAELLAAAERLEARIAATPAPTA